jgi:1-acyl-sn-glycerol-3-phosphate acyltransferase
MTVRDQLAKGARYAKFGIGWRRVLVRTAAYCTTSVTLRPFTGEGVPQTLMRYYFDGALRQLGIDIVAHGAEKLRPATPCVIAVNHNSLLDIPCVGVLLDFDYKWVSKKEIFAIPFIGWHLEACGHLWVDRKAKDNSARLAREFHRIFGEGGSILMFPEGTRSPDGHLQKFKKGAFVTALTENVPVVPVALDGTERILVKGSLHFPKGQRKTVGVKVMDPIAPPDPAVGDFDERVARMRDEVWASMARALDDLRGAPGAAARPTV